MDVAVVAMMVVVRKQVRCHYGHESIQRQPSPFSSGGSLESQIVSNSGAPILTLLTVVSPTVALLLCPVRLIKYLHHHHLAIDTQSTAEHTDIGLAPCFFI